MWPGLRWPCRRKTLIACWKIAARSASWPSIKLNAAPMPPCKRCWPPAKGGLPGEHAIWPHRHERDTRSPWSAAPPAESRKVVCRIAVKSPSGMADAVSGNRMNTFTNENESAREETSKAPSRVKISWHVARIQEVAILDLTGMAEQEKLHRLATPGPAASAGQPALQEYKYL